MTNDQMTWAEQFDWFANSFVNAAGNGFVVVRDADTFEGFRVFGTFGAMRAWAGF